MPDSLWDALAPHIEEFRSRLVAFFAVFVLLFFAGFAVSGILIAKLVTILEPFGLTIVVSHPLDYLFAQLKVASLLALVLSLPFLLYHILRFVLPGLTSKERRWLFMGLPASLLLFAVGVGFSAVVMWLTLKMLAALALSSGVGNYWDLEELISFIAVAALFFGLLFQMPLVLLLLSKLGVVRRESLAGNRKVAYFLAFVFAGVITPTVDPMTLLLVAVPMIALFEFSLLLMRMEKRQPGT